MSIALAAAGGALIGGGVGLFIGVRITARQHKREAERREAIVRRYTTTIAARKDDYGR